LIHTMYQDFFFGFKYSFLLKKNSQITDFLN
jgi:hypothetical protein